MKNNEKIVIGWNEHVDLPDWGIFGLPVKIDTGAKTSSLDVDHIEVLDDGWVSFFVVLRKKPKVLRKRVNAKVSRISKVKASPVHREKRFFVTTQITIGGITKEIELNLVDRSNMVYRMLLGRSAIKENFLVDVEHANLLGQKKRTKKREA